MTLRIQEVETEELVNNRKKRNRQLQRHMVHLTGSVGDSGWISLEFQHSKMKEFLESRPR